MLRKESQRKYGMDMCHGPLLKKILVFALPLIASGLLQLCYNAADTVVVGRFADADALAAVGANTHLIDLLVNLALGLSVGINVLAAQCYGAKKFEDVNRTVHNALCLALLLGVSVGVAGILLGERLLALMACPENIIGQAVLYLRIYMLSMPAMLIYNFGAAILRSAGNTRQPLQFLTISGIVNVLVNLLLIIVFRMGVAGVAIATAASQYLSAALMLRCLHRREDCLRLSSRKLGLQWDLVKPILYIGIPAGLQSTLIALPNVLIDACVNSFGSQAVAGVAASNNLEGFLHAAMVAISNTAQAFIGQNVGGRQYGRITKIVKICILLELVTAAGMAALFCVLSEPLLRIYLPSAPEAAAVGAARNLIVFSGIFLMGFINVFMAAMRGMGYSITPAVTVLAGLCGVRVAWICTVFAAERTLPVLFLAFPASWIVTAGAQFVCYLILYRRFLRQNTEQHALEII